MLPDTVSFWLANGPSVTIEFVPCVVSLSVLLPPSPIVAPVGPDVSCSPAVLARPVSPSVLSALMARARSAIVLPFTVRLLVPIPEAAGLDESYAFAPIVKVCVCPALVMVIEPGQHIGRIHRSARRTQQRHRVRARNHRLPRGIRRHVVLRHSRPPDCR